MLLGDFPKKNTYSGILPYAKQGGVTSFASLGCIKKALGTKKVGHTGTLDSFADGLLVVLTGTLTRLVPYITLFDKTYEAVIAFGEQTDTLDPCGTVVRRAVLPDVQTFERAFSLFRGQLMQSPPAYSALHVNGKRASDLARAGVLNALPERPVTVYKSEVLEMQLTAENRVRYARVLFHVSKGTYIRSLARDIGCACASAAHVIGLRRTAVGCFCLDRAAFAGTLADFTIESVVRRLENRPVSEKIGRAEQNNTEYFGAAAGKAGGIDSTAEAQTIRRSLVHFTPETAEHCGLIPLRLRAKYRFDFMHGKPLKADFFEHLLPSAVCSENCCGQIPHLKKSGGQSVENIEVFADKKTMLSSDCAVFFDDGAFAGVVQARKIESGAFPAAKFTYAFVVT